MADNKLLPYSAAQINPNALVGSTTYAPTAAPALNLSYPSWMSNSGARGIGNAFTPDYVAPGAGQQIVGVDPTFAHYDPPAPVVDQSAYGSGGGVGTTPFSASEGSSAASADANGYGGGQGQYGSPLGALDPTDRVPTSAALGPYGQAAFAGLTAALGPVGMALGAANTLGNAINTGANASQLNALGSPMSIGQIAGGVLGLNGYSGGLGTAIDSMAQTAQNAPGVAGGWSADTAVGPTGSYDPGAGYGASVSQESLGAPSGTGGYGGSFSGNDPNGTGYGGGSGNGYGGGDNGSDGGGGGGTDSSSGDGGGGGHDSESGMNGGNFKGGVLTKNKLVGPNPKGPDDGYASVESGEGVLTRRALAHYGPGIVAKLNKLVVSKAALR